MEEPLPVSIWGCVTLLTRSPRRRVCVCVVSIQVVCYCSEVRPELSVGLFSSTQPNPTHQITDPTQPTPNRTPIYIEQQLACRKKISLCTSCHHHHHHHPNAHRNNANTHSITSITVIIRPISDRWSSDAPTASFHKTNLPVDTRHKVTYIHDMYFSHICHFRPMTQPNPLKAQIFDPFPTQPNPTRGSTQPTDNSGTASLIDVQFFCAHTHTHTHSHTSLHYLYHRDVLNRSGDTGTWMFRH